MTCLQIILEKIGNFTVTKYLVSSTVDWTFQYWEESTKFTREIQRLRSPFVFTCFVLIPKLDALILPHMGHFVARIVFIANNFLLRAAKVKDLSYFLG